RAKFTRSSRTATVISTKSPLASDKLLIRGKIAGHDCANGHRNPGSEADRRLRLRDPEYRDGGAKSRGVGPPGEVSEHRRSDYLRLHHSAPPCRGGDAGSTRRPQ